MALVTGSWFVDLISVGVSLVIIFVVCVKWSYTYWSQKGLLTAPSTFFFGSSAGVFLQKQSFGDFTEDLYKYFKNHGKVHGGFYFLLMPTYMPVDPEILRHVMQNDFDHFADRGIYHNEQSDPLSAHLFSLEGTKWRKLRAKLTPTFTSGRMKMMFDTLRKCGDQLIIEMDKKMGAPLDTKNMLERFTTDVIGNCAFGIDCNSLKNPDNDFTKHLRLFFVDGFWDNIAGIITFVAPQFARKLSMKVVNTELSKFFMKIIKDTVEYRESNNIYRKDFMHLLLQLKNRGKLSEDGSILQESIDDKDKNVNLTMNELAAQAFVFFLAGFETSSTTMTFCLYELASNPEIQEKLRGELCEVLQKHNNKLTYEAIMDMRYMEQVVNETLRKYPPLPVLNRICTKTYKVPGTDLIIEEGTKMWIPVLGLHHDPEFYPDPEKFDPDRFLEKNKNQRLPYTFIPFGDGPRICIGLRFGVMQTKVGLSTLLKKYKFTVNKEQTAEPLKLNPKSFILNTEGGIWLDYIEV